jgi:hypothetical protein
MNAQLIQMPLLDVAVEPAGLPLLAWVLVLVAAGGLAGIILLFRARNKNK